MYCSKCGNELKTGDTFCPKCGTKVGSNGKFPIYIVIIVALVLIIVILSFHFASFKKRSIKSTENIDIVEESEIIISSDDTQNQSIDATTEVNASIQSITIINTTIPTTAIAQTATITSTENYTMGTGVVVNAPPVAESMQTTKSSTSVKETATLTPTTTKIAAETNNLNPPISPAETTILNNGPNGDSGNEKNHTGDGKSDVAPSENVSPNSSTNSTGVKIQSTIKISDTFEGDDYDCKVTLVKPVMQGKDIEETENMNSAIDEIMDELMGNIEEIVNEYDTFPKSVTLSNATLGSVKKAEIFVNLAGSVSFKSGSSKTLRYRIIYDREEGTANLEKY